MAIATNFTPAETPRAIWIQSPGETPLWNIERLEAGLAVARNEGILGQTIIYDLEGEGLFPKGQDYSLVAGDLVEFDDQTGLMIFTAFAQDADGEVLSAASIVETSVRVRIG